MYKGQTYNPAEDDNITTESLFKVINADTGEHIDVRELLGVTEEDFAKNPELLNALMHMNNIQPIEQQPKLQEIETTEMKGNNNLLESADGLNGGGANQKARHFKYFEMLDVIPKGKDGKNLEPQEALEELNVEGASKEVITWKQWWDLKAQTNKELVQAIRS